MAKKITLKTKTPPSLLATVCRTEWDCPCEAFECPFNRDGGFDCENVTSEMWAELMEEEDGNTASR